MSGRTLFTLGRPLGASLLLCGLLVAAAAAVGASWADLSGARDERDAGAALLERGVAASRRAQAKPATADGADPFVVADTGTLAAASLDAAVRSLATAAGVSLLSSRADEKGAEPGIGTRIEDQAVIEGRNEALQAVLVRLETGSPTVLVEDLAMEPAEVDQGAGVDPQDPRLRVSLTLTAFWRPGPTASGKPAPATPAAQP